MPSPALSPGSTVSVIGGGTMGAGIAQVAAAAGHEVLLLDSRAGAAAKAVEGIRGMFERLAAKGKMTPDAARAAGARLRAADGLGETAGSALAIEAIVEDLDAKRRLFADLEAVVGAGCILATNTSSLSVTAIAAALKAPARFAGMHFFNPAPLMELVEVVAGAATGADCLETLSATAAAWGKLPVLTKSTPGFIVNRVARPFYGEPLRLLSERAASAATIDALFRESGGFRMGPFELMDLIGNDVNLAVTRAVWEAFFLDPRYQPSLIQQELVQAGFLGRKSGRGHYDYREGAARPAPATEAPAAGPAGRPIRATLEGDGAWRGPLAERLSRAGVELVAAGGDVVLALTDGRTATRRSMDDGIPNLVLVDLALDYATATRVGVARAHACGAAAYAAAVAALQSAGLAVSPVADVPGMVVMRTVAMLANEALDAVAQGVCTREAVDAAMRRGVNYPAGPVAWAEAIGAARVLGVLESLATHYGGERHRVAPPIRRAALTGEPFTFIP